MTDSGLVFVIRDLALDRLYIHKVFATRLLAEEDLAYDMNATPSIRPGDKFWRPIRVESMAFVSEESK